ncbi:hypothetical protein [Psychrobacter frigidicola]|uniref:hypothetical protein n=1 Tax=Psychrobacter frigidicola TaxID=45611 RepID=UPI001D105FFA|nr:hypothetical protein [Psychrobacter frigidicola]
MAKMYLRSSDKAVLAAHKATLPNINTFEPIDIFGSWDNIMSTFFVDGGLLDTLARPSQQ